MKKLDNRNYYANLAIEIAFVGAAVIGGALLFTGFINLVEWAAGIAITR
tara:strand:+ start:206 stop:352 length:147 start_codon:yes stop_codon:yes gene_type:complete